jgi:hypothetical protein
MRDGRVRLGADVQGLAQSQKSSPLSRTIRQVPGASSRQIDVKVANCFPPGAHRAVEARACRIEHLDPRPQLNGASLPS